MEDNDVYRFIILICQKVNRRDDDVIKSHVNKNQSVLFHFSEKTRCNERANGFHPRQGVCLSRSF